MTQKELLWELAVKSVKTLLALFTLLAAGLFVSGLPYARELPFFSGRLPVSVFLGAVVSALAVAVFIKFGSEISPVLDGVLEFLPGAGRLARSVAKVLALLFSYYAFQEAVFPFIGGFEWVYQALFLGFTLFFTARAALQIYSSSEAVSRSIVGTLRSSFGVQEGGGKEGADRAGKGGQAGQSGTAAERTEAE